MSSMLNSFREIENYQLFIIYLIFLMGWVCSVPMRCPTLLHYLEPWKNKPRAKIVTKECLPTFFLNFFMLYFQTFNFLCVFAMSL